MASMTMYQVQPPEPFTFSRPSEWPKWVRRFKRFRTTTELANKSKEVQANTLLHTMGEEAEDISKIVQAVQGGPEDIYIYIYIYVQGCEEEVGLSFREKAHRHLRESEVQHQEEGKPVEAFVTDLYTLVEHCAYGDLHEEMIRDCLVVGIRSAKLSEKLQLDARNGIDPSTPSGGHKTPTIRDSRCGGGDRYTSSGRAQWGEAISPGRPAIETLGILTHVRGIENTDFSETHFPKHLGGLRGEWEYTIKGAQTFTFDYTTKSCNGSR